MKAHSVFARPLLLLAILASGAQFCHAQGLDAAGDPLCVSNIQTEDTGTGAIRLSWSLPAPQPEGQQKGKILFYAIYRDQRPIYSGTRVKSLYPIAAVPKTHISYTDEVEDGKSYYYAVLSFVDRNGVDSNYKDLYYDEELDGPEAAIPDEDSGMLYAVILPGINASISPARAASPDRATSPDQANAQTGTAVAHAPAGTAMTNSPVATPPTLYVDMPQGTEPSYRTDPSYRADSSYTMDRMSVPQTTAGGTILREEAETKNKERSISANSEKNASSLVPSQGASKRKATPLFRHIFSEDQAIPAGGDDYLLYEILQKSWIKYSYVEAKAALSTFLAQRRDEGPTHRAIFYLAEAEYFTGNYDGALKLFLSVQDSFPQLAGKWIDSCIDLY